MQRNTIIILAFATILLLMLFNYSILYIGKSNQQLNEKNREQKQGERASAQYEKMKEMMEEVLVPVAVKLNALENQITTDLHKQQTQLQLLQTELKLKLTHEAEKERERENEKEKEMEEEEKNKKNEKEEEKQTECSHMETNNDNNNKNNKGELNWEEAMAKLDWKVVEEAEKSRNHNLPDDWVYSYFEAAIPFLEEVKAPLVNTTRPPVEIDCSKMEYSHFLTGKRRVKPVRVFDLAELAYELDVLEIRLFELEDVVDEFVILEGIYTHIGIKKPLFFERNYQRFSRWREKIKYMVWDERMSLDSDRLNGIHNKYDWSLETKSRQFLMNAFIELHRGGADFNEDDLFILADLDEIPHRDPIAHLKHCEVKANFLPARFDAIFWRFSFHWQFNEYMNFPSVVSWKNINVDRVSLRHIHPNLIGHQAWHLNRFGPAIMQVVKEFSIAEGSLNIPSNNPQILRNITYVEDLMHRGIRPCCPKDRLKYFNDPRDFDYPVPWIILANEHTGRWNFL